MVIVVALMLVASKVREFAKPFKHTHISCQREKMCETGSRLCLEQCEKRLCLYTKHARQSLVKFIPGRAWNEYTEMCEPGTRSMRANVFTAIAASVSKI
jgi:hypothetical protein